MQSYHSLTDKGDDPTTVYDLVAKIDRMLRLYRNCKSADPNILSDVKCRVEKIMR